MHLKNYTQPAHQRFIIRICFMVPIYAICSWFSLLHRPASLYLDTFRDCYESWVVYNFLNLCLAYVGGPGNVVNRMAGKEVEPSCWAMTCCLPPLPIDGVYIRRCRQGAIQFVLLKPILAGLTMLLTWGGVYGDNEIEADKAYPYITFVYNMSYTLALYALLLFYLGAHDLLKPYKPVMKFVLVKSVIFLTFWQSIVCAILVSDGVLETGADGRALQNVLICVEMIIAAPFMLLAFPWSPYTGMGTKGMFNNISHAISIDDVVSDTVHQFAPTYQEYVLHGTEGGPTRKIRLKTHVMMGQEMMNARNGGAGAARGGGSGSSQGRRPASTTGRDERPGAGMLANAGFENSYGMRDVQDDYQDDDDDGWDGGGDGIDGRRRKRKRARGDSRAARIHGRDGTARDGEAGGDRHGVRHGDRSHGSRAGCGYARGGRRGCRFAHRRCLRADAAAAAEEPAVGRDARARRAGAPAGVRGHPAAAGFRRVRAGAAARAGPMSGDERSRALVSLATSLNQIVIQRAAPVLLTPSDLNPPLFPMDDTFSRGRRG